MEFKFLPATEEHIERIYFNVRATMLDFEMNTNAYFLEPRFMELYKKIKANLKDYRIVRYEGMDVGHYYFHPYKDGMMVEDIFIEYNYRYCGACSSILRRCISETELPVYAPIYGNNVLSVSVFRSHGFVVDEWINHYKVIMVYDNTEPFDYANYATRERISDWMRESYVEYQKRKARIARRKAKEEKKNSALK